MTIAFLIICAKIQLYVLEKIFEFEQQNDGLKSAAY